MVTPTYLQILWITLLTTAQVSQSTTIQTIDNTLVGTPLVKCGPERIEVSASTAKPFQGVIYIKNWRRVDGCYVATRNDSGLNQSPSLSIDLSALSRCGMEMKRDPTSRQVEIQGVWVFSFHPMFVTKIDKAYSIHCIFKQKEVTVTNGFNVGDLSTIDTISRTASMPGIEMRVVQGRNPDLTIQPAATVRVGDPLTFMWYFSGPNNDMNGIRVKDCFAETRKGSRVKILDNGCSLDEAAITELQYTSALDKVYANAMAFKFADTEDMWFKCTVAVCMKDHPDHTDSRTGFKEDSCGNIPKCKSRVRREEQFRRMSDPVAMGISPSLDDLVSEQKLFVLDHYNQNVTGSKESRRSSSGPSQHSGVKRRRSAVVCLRKPIFALVSSVILILYITTFILGTVAIVVHLRRRKSPDSVEYDVCQPARS